MHVWARRCFNFFIASRRTAPGGLVLPLLFGAACTLTSPASQLGGGEALVVPAALGPAIEAAQTRAREVEASLDANVDGNVAQREPPVLLDAWSLAEREDGDACREELTAAGYKFQSLKDKKEPDKSGCGIPHGVVVKRGPTGIAYDPPITVDCALARALASVERVVQEEAELHLKSRIVKIGNLGGFACRPRNYRKNASLSAHAFGSAVDVSAFHPAKGTPAIIARDYKDAPRSTAAQDDRRRFLRGVFIRLRRHEADLTYAVGPDFNAIHHNHFHLDRGGWHFWFNR